ncbi:hypothetical protein LZK77_10475 [Rhizobium leguminosarum]|nr:hypothetical protein [Rhizobium leguminosarum]MBY5467030.1 hypothetical protein [Rhizobium leguminosarum]UIJ88692.1 hypothetical protein LZK77_10475 [Rhizobium leguminosarum]UIY26316.1 hypothetical protein LZK76_10625 [Rhizobium leguminosarum]
MRVTPMAAAAPPKMGPHVMADLEDSTGVAISPEPVIETDMIRPYRTNRARRMMIGSGTPSSQSRIPRPMKDLLSETDVTWLMPLNFEPRSLFPAGLVIDDLHAELIEIDKNLARSELTSGEESAIS